MVSSGVYDGVFVGSNVSRKIIIAVQEQIVLVQLLFSFTSDN